MDKRDIYKLFSDKNKTLEDLTKEIKIEDFVGGINLLGSDKRVTYGANVRITAETDNDDIIPFNYCNVKSFQPTDVAKKVDNGFRIPDFLELFGLQEITFRVDFDVTLENTVKIKAIDYRGGADDPIPLNPYRKRANDNENFINPRDDKDTINKKLLEGFFKRSSHTFLHENLLALFNSTPKGTTFAYVWVLGEDPDVTAGDSRFHTHILAISDDSNNFFNFINSIRMNFMEFVIMLKSRRLFDAYVLQRKEAIKSAKAAIMSRNMSHNLGSHVMSYLKTNLGSVKNILKDNVLSIMLEGEKLNPKLFSEHQFNTSELTLPFLVGIGRFISYLQERQDYIATVSTDYIPYYSSVNFKDFIYDELNSDKRYERHPDRTNLKPDNILLGNIARSEGLGRHTSPTKKSEQTLSDIVLKFRTRFDGTPPEEDEVAKAELDEMRNYELSLPGGVVGRQAIFSIIENVIRNAAKHGNCKGQLELTLDIFTKEDIENKQPDEELKRRLRDDDQADDKSLSLKGVLERLYNGEYSDDYYFITLTDNLASDPKALINLRKALHEEYVNGDNRMIETNKGIKEMRISAAWLRSLRNDLELSPFNKSNDGKGEKEWSDTQSDWDKQPPVLYIRFSKGLHDQYHLQYIFCVMRPKKVAFVSSLFDAKKHFSLSRDGYFFLSPDEYLRFPNKNFEFIVYDDRMKNTHEKAMIEKERKMREENTDVNNHIFIEAKKRFEEEKTLMEKARCLSSQRFIVLSELKHPKKDFITKEDIDELISIINTIKNDPKDDDVKKKAEDFKEKTEKIYLRLYQNLSKCDSNERIFINDLKAEQNSNLSNASNLVVYKRPDSSITTYRYMTHLEDKKQFREYVINEDLGQTLYQFSEGVSGDNSTDRLVRNEPKTELWFYKHLHAMKQKVAIFDERIFAKVTGLDESDIQHFSTSSNSRSVDDDKDYIKKIITNEFDLELLDIVKTREELNKFIKDHEIDYHIDLPKSANSDCDDLRTKNHLGATYKYKNLHIFTIIRSEEDPERFNLYGIEIDKGNNDAFSKCIRYATLRWDCSNKRLIIENDAKQKTDWMQFHSLSIHQGLLDKLYTAFGIQKNDIELKENLTKDFYKHFIIDANDKKIKFRDSDNIQRYFLPGMTIHSGRSKPSKEDMPQRLPFIPYSALEHAMLDCKFSIVELLDSARYE